MSQFPAGLEAQSVLSVSVKFTSFLETSHQTLSVPRNLFYDYDWRLWNKSLQTTILLASFHIKINYKHGLFETDLIELLKLMQISQRS